MRNRLLLSAGALALVASSCAQPDPQILSDAPRSATATELTTSTESRDREPQQGRFIARCATEADGGTPGMTFFTDGTQNVTDHCLSRYYIGVQPAPGALYVADEDAGAYAPTRGTEDTSGTSAAQWTPAQPRTDAGPRDPLLDGPDGREPGTGTGEVREPGTGEPTPESPDTPASPTEGAPTTSPAATPPGETGPTGPGQTGPTTPGQPGPTSPGGTDPSTTGSTEQTPTAVPNVTVPTVTEVPGARPAPTPSSLGSVDPLGSGAQGSQGSQAAVRPQGLPPLPWFVGPTARAD